MAPSGSPDRGYYVAINDEGFVDDQHRSRAQKKHHRRLIAVAGATSLLLFLLLFFLIPRRPVVRYNYSVFTPELPLRLSQQFSYYNPNFYSVKWKNLHIEVVYLPPPERDVQPIPLGYGSHAPTFEVGPLSTGYVDVNVTVIATDSQLAMMCQGVTSAQFQMSGTVEALIWSQSLGVINVGPFESTEPCR